MSKLLSLSPIRQRLAESLSKAWNRKIDESEVICPSEIGHASYYTHTVEQSIAVASRRLNEAGGGIYDCAWVEGYYINFRLSRFYMNEHIKEVLKSAKPLKDDYVISEVLNEYEYAIARMYMLSTKPANNVAALLNDKIFKAVLLALHCNDDMGDRATKLRIAAKKCLEAIDREEYYGYIGDIAKLVALCLEHAAANL